MLITPSAWQALLDAGVDVLATGKAATTFSHGRSRAELAVHAKTRRMTPSEIAALLARDSRPGLLLVPSASPAALRLLAEAGWSWLLTGGRRVTGTLQIGPDRVPIGEDDAAPPPPRPRTGRTPWGTFTLVRLLLQRPARQQHELALAAGISQPRVSQVLTILSRLALVVRDDQGWRVRDVDGIVDWWLDRYRGPGGVTTYWYGLDPPREQARRALEALRGPAGRTAALVSGDVAADVIAPWRSPARVVLHARQGADLTRAGLTPAGADEATVELTVPDDPGIWVAAASEPSDTDLPLADPLQVLWDVRRSAGADSAEAVDRLRAVLRSRLNAPESAG